MVVLPPKSQRGLGSLPGIEPRMEPKGRAHMITQMGEYLNDDNVLLGIASVIETIMAHQEENLTFPVSLSLVP